MKLPSESNPEADKAAESEGTTFSAPAARVNPSYDEYQTELRQRPGSFSDRVLHRVGNELWRIPSGVTERQGTVIDWSIPAGLLSWLFSVCVLFLCNALAWIMVAFYYSSIGKKLTTSVVASDPGVVLSSVISTLPAHVMTLFFCWIVVTRFGKQPFFETLGWRWHPKFRPIHALGFVLSMFVIAQVFARFLPNSETPFDQMIRTSAAIRIATAVLAVFTAPIVEEVVYRGVLFAPLARRFGNVAAIFSVAVLFAVVHVPQNWGGWATIAGLTTLSFGLTIVRAYTNSLLPCVAIHTIFNGIVSILLVAGKGLN